MARQRTGKVEGSAAKARQPKSKTTKATTRTTTTATTKATTKSASKTAKSTRATAQSTKMIHKSMPVAEVTAGLKPTFNEIRDRAYQIYLVRGAVPGYSEGDWLQAERELRELKAAQAASGKRRR